MAGFASASRIISNGATASNTTVITAASLAASHATVGRWLVARLDLRTGGATPPTIVGGVPVFHGGSLVTTTPVQLIRHINVAVGSTSTEIWVAQITTAADDLFNWSGDLTAEALYRSAVISVYDGFPDAFSVVDTGTYENGSSSTSHMFGEVTAAADDLLFGATYHGSGPGTVTWGTDYLGYSFARTVLAHRIATGSVTTDGAYSGTIPVVTYQSVHLVLREDAASGTEGEVDAVAPAAEAIASGAPVIGGTVAAEAPSATADASGASTVAGSSAAVAPSAEADAAGTPVVTGDVAATAPAAEAAASGAPVISGAVAAEAPSATADSEGYAYDETAKPIADVDAGSWSPSSGSDLYAMLADTIGSGDSSYIRSPASAGPNSCEIRLSPLTPPGVRTVRIRIRHRLAP